jgi:hypothetical protein
VIEWFDIPPINPGKLTEIPRSKGPQVHVEVRNMPNCPSHHCQYFYRASAYGLAAEIERPIQQSVESQAACTLAGSGGRGAQRVEKLCVSPFICFDRAYSEVGGSFDDCHGVHTTYATSVIEGLNIADVVTADRVVARMVVYSPTHDNENGEHSFDITGSHFDNLKIAGHTIDIKLATHTFHAHDTYSKFEKAFHGGDAADLLPWGKQSDQRLAELQKLEDQYHALNGIGARARQWNKKSQRRKGGVYWSSAAGHFNLHEHVDETELQGFGGIILVPKFGVIRLAQVLVDRDYRRLNMFHVQMCSGTTGTSDGGTTSGGGGTHFP